MIGALLGVGCADEQIGPVPSAGRPAASASGPGAARKPVDTDLVAFLSKARAAHHAADIAESSKNLPLAIDHVAMIPAGPLPRRTPEVIEVVADAHARLADLKSRIGAFDDAVAETEAGLGIAKEITHYRGHLFEVRGVVEERRMEALLAAGDKAGAEKAKQDALDAFDTAITIQNEVILKLLPDEPDPAPPASAKP